YAFGVPQYPRHRMRAAHTPLVNRYIFPNDLLTADCLINIPKLKSHQKAGITVSLKNLVGINGHKDYLPHFRFGSPQHVGAECPDDGLAGRLVWGVTHLEWEFDRGPFKKALILLRKAAEKALLAAGLLNPELRFIHGGAWNGNDTLWRTVLDINRAFFYFDRAE